MTLQPICDLTFIKHYLNKALISGTPGPPPVVSNNGACENVARTMEEELATAFKKVLLVGRSNIGRQGLLDCM